MQSQSLQSPCRQRFELVIIFSHLATIEAELSPSNDLVQKSFSILASTPPTGTAARCAYGEMAWRPAFLFCEFRENLMHGNMPKVEVRREFARGLLGWFISRLSVSWQLISQEVYQ